MFFIEEHDFAIVMNHTVRQTEETNRLTERTGKTSAGSLRDAEFSLREPQRHSATGRTGNGARLPAATVSQFRRPARANLNGLRVRHNGYRP